MNPERVGDAIGKALHKTRRRAPVFWTMKNGDRIRMHDMTWGHLKNAYATVVRNGDAVWAQRLRNEIAERTVSLWSGP